MQILHIILIIVFFLLLILAIKEILSDNICDDQHCGIFYGSLLEEGSTNQTLYLLDRLCISPVWPFAYLAASLLSPLLVTTIPMEINIHYFATTFLIIFITFYCIMSFIIYHYITPFKNYIIDQLTK